MSADQACAAAPETMGQAASARVSLLGLATAVPQYVLHQDEVARASARLFAATYERFPALGDVFGNAGIERRYSVRPVEWFYEPRDFTERSQAYIEGACGLFVEAATAALARAGVPGRDVDVVVTISSTGIATPSLEAHVAPQLGLRPDVVRVPVFGLGCAGGVSGLAIGSHIARGLPGRIVLIVAVELCTLAFRSDRGLNADVVSTALFGDGAAAAVVCVAPGAGTATIGGSHQHTWPETLDIMGWSIDPTGFGVVLSRSLPRFIEDALAAPMHCFLGKLRLDESRVRPVCHPGGAKVLAALELALRLGEDALADERVVLRDFGNMSAPTVMFVLERVLRHPSDKPLVLAALGPGFTASFLELRVQGRL